ncbi:hypothetical protein WG66_008497 [Moniliophthora roreri]|nr:hypothetical protein WG66_008497 [Moniliophthora roreri]
MELLAGRGSKVWTIDKRDRSLTSLAKHPPKSISITNPAWMCSIQAHTPLSDDYLYRIPVPRILANDAEQANNANREQNESRMNVLLGHLLPFERPSL